ncbi:Sjogren's syndrome/scleroderma autoantigen 1 family protein [Halapricum desulfuricans]|uniref:Putative Zn-finger containing protein n=1 Tax=Halapricum desulfuricans TaxID=2841257 RepID=A0A897NAI6_9EURY|nr:Sjogren's syndrome/scleroderma autoantigen 1 family protein [Halapricum desulfuricans]QSG07406.1 putative Zn-finger containing protein [Halapricum desulfuricans]
MSDFDEEAERERLRQQYEREEEQREATERMSELLLKGATMTNVHCETCGDPIFRYEGQLFCPTCEEVVDENGTKVGGGTGADGSEAGSEPAESGSKAEPSGPESGTDTESTTEPGTDAESEPAAASERSASARGVETDSTEDADAGSTDQASELPERRERPDVPDRDRGPGEELRRPDPPARREEFEREASDERDDLRQAKASLRRSLLRFAREAERADDPRRARESLEAASEAADALVSVSELR